MAHWLARWLARLPLLDLAAGTRESYEGLTRRHLIPYLGDFLLTRLRRQDVRKAWLAMRAAGASFKTIRNCYIALSSAMAEALDEELIDHNPAHGSTKRLWKGPLCPPPRILPAVDYPAFARAVAVVAPELSDLFETLAGAGLRIGEGLGLQKQDVDRERPALHITRTWIKGRAGRVKSRRPRRVEISLELATRLRNRAAMLDPEVPWLFVSSRRKGVPWGYDYVGKRMRRAIEMAGLPRATPHSLRHAFASFILEETGDLVFVSRQVGHQTVQLTVDLYGYWAAPRRPDAMRLLHDVQHPPPRPSARVLPFRRPPPRGGSRKP